jgi:hypothetical protein
MSNSSERLGARCNATAFADSSDDRDQDRPHDRVTIPQICSSRSPLLARPRPARSDIRLPSQIVRQLEELDATRRSFVSCFTVKQLVASARSKSARSPALI